MAAQTELVGAGFEIVEEHVLGREVQRPVVSLRKRVAVIVIGVVDAASGIGVLEPGTAYVGVLLDDHEADARLLESMAREQARHACADDDHCERGVGRDVGRRLRRTAATDARQRPS